MRKKKEFLPSFDVSAFEDAVEAFIEQAESNEVFDGPAKKKLVINLAAKWLDDAIKLPGILELVDRWVFKAGLWLLSGWIESIFKRWKAKKAAK